MSKPGTPKASLSPEALESLMKLHSYTKHADQALQGLEMVVGGLKSQLDMVSTALEAMRGANALITNDLARVISSVENVRNVD